MDASITGMMMAGVTDTYPVYAHSSLHFAGLFDACATTLTEGGGDCPLCSDVALTADGRFAKISPNLYEGGGGGASLKTPIGFYHHYRHEGSGPSEFRAFGSPSCLIVGGNWNNGASDGLSAWNSNNDLSNSNTNIGARLAYPSDHHKFNTVTLGKDLAPWQKITKNYNHPAGRWASGYAHPNVGIEVDRIPKGVCL